MHLQDLGTRNYFVAVGGFLAVLFALLGPEGSTDLGLVARLLQWLAQVAIPLTLLIATHLLLSRSSTFDRQNPWLKLTLSGLLGSLLFAPFALALDFLFGIDDWNQVATTTQLMALLADETLGVLFPVTLVWLGINAPRVVGLDFSQADPASARPADNADPGEPAPDPAARPASGFLSLLPKEVGTDLVYLMSELHYLRVVTTNGSTLVLYNLRDAVAELPPEAGLQPHRSYWVATRHLCGLIKHRGKAYLQLSDDSRIPVSRRRLHEVRERVDSLTQV